MRAMSNDSQQSLTSHDVTTLSNLALTGAELLTATNDEGVERTSDVEAQEEDALVSNDGASSDEESSDDEIDEEDEYLMQPPSQ